MGEKSTPFSDKPRDDKTGKGTVVLIWGDGHVTVVGETNVASVTPTPSNLHFIVGVKVKGPPVIVMRELLLGGFMVGETALIVMLGRAVNS